MNNNLGNRVTMAKNIRHYMSVYGYNSKELAEAIGVSPASVSGWLAGTYYPRIDRIEKMSNLFHITKADLVEEQANDLAIQLLTYPLNQLELTDEEIQLILNYRGSSDEIQRVTRNMLADSASTNISAVSNSTQVS